MRQFNEFYFEEGFGDDLRRAFTKNIFKTTTVGVNLTKYKPNVNLVHADIENFDRVKSLLQRDVVAYKAVSRKLKYSKNKPDFGNIYGKRVFIGEIDKGSEYLIGEPVATIVYQLNNGGKIIFITTQEGEYFQRYIACGNRAMSYFTDKLGTTLQQVYADSVGRNRSRVAPRTGVEEIDQLNKELKEKDKTIAAVLGSDKAKKKTKDYEKDDLNQMKQGVIDIQHNIFKELSDVWSDGITGKQQLNVSKGAKDATEQYPFKGLFTRYKYNQDGYDGYKYEDSYRKYKIYLLSKDRKDVIIFDSPGSYDWAKRINMLSYWGLDKKDVRWESNNPKNIKDK